MGPRRGQDGALEFILPMGDKRLSGIASENIGKCAYGLFKQGAASVGRRVGIAGEHLTGDEMASQLSRALDQKVSYRAIPFEVYRSLGFPGAEDLANMFQFYHDFEDAFTSARNLEEARSLNPELLTFERWLERYKDRLQIQ